jgi:fibronectin type 3 domain-containing protein
VPRFRNASSFLFPVAIALFLTLPGFSEAHTDNHKAPVYPILECVTAVTGGSYTALFGYKNENSFTVTIPIGSNNKFSPLPIDRGQTTVFKPGRITGAFRVSFNGSNLVWTLQSAGDDDNRRTATASSKSTRCANQPPKAVNDTAGTVQGTAVTIPVLANDSDPEGAKLTITSVTTPAHGSTTINTSGTITYTPVASFSGTDSFIYTISDGAGGTTTATVTVTISPDTVAPVITASASPAPNAAGWNNTNVAITFTCSDAASGVVFCPAAVTVTTEGAGQVIAGTASDKAGNTKTVTVLINLDKTPPVISFSASPPPNANGWNNTNVTVSFTCSDAASGIATCPAPAALTTEGSNQLVTGTATDLAGNAATTHVTANIDKTAPTINIISPQNDAVLNLSKPEIAIEFSGGFSGIDTVTVNLFLDGFDVTSDALITASGLTYTPNTALQDGAHSILVSISDNANNTGNVSTTFTTKTRTRPFIFPEPGFDAVNDKYNSYFNGPTKVGDINRDGISDVVVLNHVMGAFISKISVIPGKGDGSFEKPITIGELYNGYYDDIAVDDFNGDGSPDLALTAYLSNGQNQLLLVIGRGDGTFTAGGSYALDSTGKVLTGKFDTDPYVDIAIAYQNGNVSLFHGNGDGSFNATVAIWSGPADSWITDAITVDFNHDGLADIGLIVGDGSGGREFLTLLNNGDGTFQSFTVLPGDDSHFISSLTFGDLNGDGYADILVLRDGQFNFRPDIIVFMNDGNGGFTTSHVYSPGLVIPSGNFSIFGSRTVRLSDLNGDQKLDLLISYLGEVFTFPGNGDGTFQPPSESSVSGGWLTIGDFDQDGAKDLLTVGASDIFILFGRVDRGFIDREEIPTSEVTYNIASADLDGDRTPDLVLPGDGFVTLFSTILNRGNTWMENNVGPPFQTDRTYQAGNGPVFVKMGDLNKDGHPDLVVVNELSNDVSVLLNSGDGDLKSSVSYPVGSAPVFIALEDLNQDGCLDIITANSGSNDISILLGRADGSFQTQTIYAAGPNPKSLAIADINGDGHPDIVVTDYDLFVNYVSILLGNGDGAFQPYYRWTTIGRFPIAIQTGDFNRDGLADFAVVNYSLYSWGGIQSSMVTLLLGKGDGTFDERIVYQSSNIFVFDDILSEDLNRDGKQDLIVFDYHAGSAWVFLNDGYGQFNEIKAVGGLEGLLLYGGLSATLGDLNHDGNLDLLVGGGNSLQAWLGQGDGTFISSPSIGGWDNVASIAVGDMNGDGVPDIALVDDNNLSLIPGTGDGLFPGERAIPRDTSDFEISGLAAADLNGDHNQDIVLSEIPYVSTAGYPKAVIYWGAGDNTFRQGPTLQTSTLFNRGVFAADFNQDGLVDIVLAQKPAVLVYLNNGDQTFREPIPYTINEMLGGIRIADINHDNRLDLISLDATPSSNQFGEFSYSLSIHTGNGDGTFQYYGTIPLDQPTVSDLVVQDLNGDGFGDLAIYMESDNTLRIYLNNGNGTFNGPITYEIGIGPGALMAQDFNQDGFVDLAIRDLESINLFLGNGDGTFQPPTAYGLGEAGGGGIVSRDFNLDGRLDIAAPGSNQVNLLLNLLPPLHTPPSPPKNLAGVAGDGSVFLIWAASPEADVTGYNLYRSLTSGGGYAKINSAPIASLSYTDTTVANGQLYFYAVAAMNVQGDESSFSRKVKAAPHPADTTPPVVKIATPINGGIAVIPLLFVSGTIDDVGAVVTVNGHSAAVQTQDRTFAAYNIPLNLGVNIVAVTAVDSAGNRSSDTVTVTYALVAGMTGTVQDALSGVPIEGATVSIQDADGTQTFTTQSNGLYSFTRLVPGQVTLTVTTLNYYQPSTLIKTFLPGQVMTLNIPLELRPAVLTGTVYDAFRTPSSRTYTPIAGATVTVTDHAKTQTAASDSNGRYRLENISPTDITVTVMKAGYETDQQTLSLYPQLTQLYNFYLNKPPPSAPTGLIATPVIRGVALKWNANMESDLLGYNVYRATTSGDDYTLLNISPVASPSYKDAGLTGGTTYYYVVTAINTSRRESDNSAEVSATTPSATIPITITFPANGAGINSSNVIVAGTINATVNEIGVVIEVSGPNGIESVPAHVNRSSFGALVPLQAGTNTITAVAVDPGGAYGEASVTVNVSIPQEEVRLTANPESGVPDIATGGLAVKLQVLTTLPNPATQYQWDYEGNGTIDQTGAALTEITVQYHAVGIYYPTVIITDTLGNTYTATTVVNVLSREELDALLKSKWEEMKTALINGDIEGALTYYLENSRERYRGIFSALGNHIQEIASSMQSIELIYMNNGLAKYRIRRAEDAGLITYYIHFQIDDNGVWRIKQF